MYKYRQKIHFITPIVSEILKIKNPVNQTWESLEIATWEWNFYQTCAFNRIIKVIMMYDLDQKNLHVNELIFLQNPKNSFSRVFLGIIPKLRFFP